MHAFFLCNIRGVRRLRRLVRRGWVWSGDVGSGQERLGLVRRGWVWPGLHRCRFRFEMNF